MTDFCSGEAVVDPALFKQGMRRLAAGVAIVATAFEGTRYGLVATAVSSVSAEPPTLLVCVSGMNAAHPFIMRAGYFSVNVLHQDDRSLAENFANPEKRAQRFSMGEWSTLTTGAPVLSSALASFDCRIVQQAHMGTHTVFFGRVEQVLLRDGEVSPLLFWDGTYRNVSSDA